ncbi:hypothetical protein VNI00_010008 [Paramarasmius palmivorus]|uniref:DUF4139 domain-containing protein n=1 Tax=Paramarasmius palmivorus TaxID=297713 RepID=A0AAW0CN55_9AGAR
MDSESLRVEGRGYATIQDVNISHNQDVFKSTSVVLEGLLEKKMRLEKALERCKKSVGSLESFLKTVNAQHIKSGDLYSTMTDYDAAARELDDRILSLEEELKGLNKKIGLEDEQLRPRDGRVLAGKQAHIGIVAEEEAEVELVLIYAVSQADWVAGYDIRVDTTETRRCVTMVYKAIVSQTTQESWDNVPLTLETANPTYGVKPPTLEQWTLSVFKPSPPPAPARKRQAAAFLARATSAEEIGGEEEESDDDMGFGLFDDGPMGVMMAGVNAKGGMNPSFKVPGLVTIPPDNGERSFTIVELKLDALITWFSIPKIDTKVHLKARVCNDSEYTLLPGKASVFVDGSFIAKSDVPLVSPLEKFECALGVDPAARITYHPLQKHTSTSGFYNKSIRRGYVQRLTVQNTKPNPIPLLKIVDHVPVPENSEIMVKLVQPALKLPHTVLPRTQSKAHSNVHESIEASEESIRSKPATTTVRTLSDVVGSSVGPNIKLSDGVYVQWDRADEWNVDIEALGKNGLMNWLCEVPAQEKLNLTLEWEVNAPLKATVVGL